MSILFVNPKSAAEPRKVKKISKHLKYLYLHDEDNDDNEDAYKCALKEECILANGINGKDEKPLYPGDAVVLELSCNRLSDISVIDLCERLKVCNLSCNFLKNISPLKWCINLICLDLHSNLITRLPDRKFWMALKKLSVLYLHDNGISKLEEFRDLSYAYALVNLTLYDTPISLRKNYRHCVVNAIWSLKALDHVVISDEEIIEEANFLQRFKPLQSHFRFKPSYFPAKQGECLSLKATLFFIYKEISDINIIQAKYCPVLVLQKVIRGYLIRLRYNYIMDTRLWAAVSIQRFYRTCKGYPNPPPSTPMLYYQEFMYQSLSSIKLDYEAYLKMRRSLDPSLFSMNSTNFRLEAKGKNQIGLDSCLRKRISIDLEKLMGKATEISDKEKSNAVLQPVSEMKVKVKVKVGEEKLQGPSKNDQLLCAEQYAKGLGLNIVPSGANKDHCKIGKYFTQYKFLGQVVQPSLEDNSDPQDDVSFRLTIHKPPIMKHDPLQELVLRTVEGADDIRKSIKVMEEKMKEISPKKAFRNKNLIKRDKNLVMKNGHGTMGFSCFHAIDKAYKERSNCEQLLKRINHVKHIKQLEDLSVEKVSAHKFKHRNMASLCKKKERVALLDALSLRRQNDFTVVDNIDAKRNACYEKQKKSREDYKFAIEFNCQNASVGKALANHDRSNRKQEEVVRKSEHVDALRDATDKKHEIVSCYVENIKIARQTENNTIKRDLCDVIKEKQLERRGELMKFLKMKKEKKGAHILSGTLLPIKHFNETMDNIELA